MSERSAQVLTDPMAHGVHSSLRVPADLTVVGFVRSALACVLTREGWPHDGAARVLLASTEALTNAIEHGSPLGGVVEVEVSVSEDVARISVADQGRPGAVTPRLPAVQPPDSSVRGRGLLIISRLADGIALRADRGGTVLVVEFLRHPAAPAASRRPATVRAA